VSPLATQDDSDFIFGEPEDNLGLSLQLGMKQEPDKFSKDQAIADQFAVPRETVERNPKEFEFKIRNEEMDHEKIRRDTPSLAKFLAYPDNASQAHDDVESLSSLELAERKYRESQPRGVFENTTRGFATRAFDLVGNFAQAVGVSAKGGEQWLADFTGINPGVKFGEDGVSWKWDLDPEKTGDFLNVAGESIEEFAAEAFDYVPGFTWEELKGDVTPENLAGYIFEQGVRTIPDMFAAMYTLPAYITSRSEEIAEARVENDLRTQVEPKDLITAVPIAVTVSFLERIGALSVFKPGRITGLRQVPGAIGKATAGESATEFIQEQLEYAGETLGTKKEFSPWEMLDRGIGGAVAGGGMGGGIRSATASAEATLFGKKVQEIAQSSGEQQLLDTISQVAAESKLNQRNQGLFQQFTESLGSQTVVYVPSDVMEESYTGDDQDIIRQMEESKAMGGADIVLPIDVYTTKVAVDSNIQAIRPHARLSEESLSQFEMEQTDLKQDMIDLVGRVQADVEVRTELDEIGADVERQLIETKRVVPMHAKKMSALITSNAKAKSERLWKEKGVKISPKEIYEKAIKKVKGPDGQVDAEEALQQAKTEGYKGGSQGEAAEWVRAVQKFGPEGMTKEARMGRAKGMGFNTEQVLYHGTTHTDIESFLPKSGEALRLHRLAKKTDAPFGTHMFRKGIFFSPDPAYAGSYTEEDTGLIYPVYAKASNPAVFNGLTKQWSIRDESTTPDAMHITDGEKVVEVAIINPSQIRSVNAAFDPDFKELGDLLAQAKPGAQYAQTEVTTTETIRETGEVVEITENGEVAYNRTQQRMQSLQNMITCLRN